jgi:hypothetical protein
LTTRGPDENTNLQRPIQSTPTKRRSGLGQSERRELPRIVPSCRHSASVGYAGKGSSGMTPVRQASYVVVDRICGTAHRTTVRLAGRPGADARMRAGLLTPCCPSLPDPLSTGFRGRILETGSGRRPRGRLASGYQLPGGELQ